MLDFNDVPIGGARKVAEGSTDTAREKDEIRSALNEQLALLVLDIWPSGKRRQNKYLVGDVMGGPGDSLELLLSGPKTGLWTDRATGEGGDILDLIARYYSLDVQAQFPQVLERAKGWLGRASAMPASSVAASKAKAPAVDELGPATAKWNYQDASGKLIAVVYRYDPEPGRKEFRPWDVRRRKMAPPEPRPLFNQPGMLKAEQVVVVEGEKCAQALIDLGVCATTAMHGANAPVEKTDWSPLSGKHVLIWPDRDKPGWQYADHASQAIMQAGAKSCVILQPPAEKPEGWDVADAVQNGFDITGFLAVGERVPVVHQIDVHAPMQLVDGIDYTNEDGLAMAFSHQFSEDWRYCAPWSKWLVWNGVRWNIDKALYVMHLCRLICRAASVQADGTKLKGRLASSGTISAIERIVRSEPRHSATVEEWDSSVWLLNTPGGIVDLRTGARGPHDRDRRMTKVTTATPQGDCPVWRNFLVNVTGGDEELQDYLQRVVGYCLTGDISTHALFFLYGTGANGKSVFVNVISTVLGDYAANAPMDTFMESRSDRHPTDLAGLRGARFVSATETEQGRRWNESKIKAITGGDDITARLMHQDFFTYRPQFKLLIAGNHKPAIRNIDEAKLDFRSLANSIISDLIRIQIQRAITLPLAKAMSSFFGFADGGVMTAEGPLPLSVPLRGYASGGIANSPQLAVFGEGSRPEAYVPLPDGRTIPVTMSGGAAGAGLGSGTVFNISVNVLDAGASTRGDNAGGRDLGQAVANAVRQELLAQKRAGGLLDSRRAL